MQTINDVRHPRRAIQVATSFRAVALRRAALLWLALGTCGCAGESVSPASIEMRRADGFKWIPAADIERYRCEIGSLFCQGAIGRQSTKRCRCLE